jgi:hypothetical protein
MNADSQWPIPDDLSPLGRRAAETIVAFLTEHDATHHGGGGRFYSPAEWRDRGEEYGTESLLIVTHDGGAHAPAFNLDYEQYEFQEELKIRLEEIGVYPEQATSWYSSIHKAW